MVAVITVQCLFCDGVRKRLFPLRLIVSGCNKQMYSDTTYSYPYRNIKLFCRHRDQGYLERPVPTLTLAPSGISAPHRHFVTSGFPLNVWALTGRFALPYMLAERFDLANRYVLQPVQPHTFYAWLLVFDETSAQPDFAVMSCCVVVLSLFYSDILAWSADGLYSVQ